MFARIRALFRRAKLDRDIDDELALHLAMKEEAARTEGTPVEYAHYEAARGFGNRASLKQACRDAWTFAWLEALFCDLKYSARQARKNTGFALIAIFTLALGIGATTAVFTMVDSILLRPLPYSRPHDLYSVREVVRQEASEPSWHAVNAGNFLLWRQHCPAFSALALVEPSTDNLILRDETIQIHGARAAASLFALLGIAPQLGRTFLPAEDRAGTAMLIVLTHALWRDRFQSDQNIVGKTIRLNGYPYTVIGVLPASFYFPKQEQLVQSAIAGWDSQIQYFTNLWLQNWDTKAGVNDFNFAAIGRLRPGVARQQALAQVNAIESQIAKQSPGGGSLSAELLPLKTAIAGGAGPTLWMLLSGAAVMLLIVCVNLAGLLLARSTGRTHEVAVRCALGASRGVLLRQFLVEGLLLSLAGGALGVTAAYFGVEALAHSAPISLPRLESVHMDMRVLLFSAAISIAAGLFFSLLPGLRLSGDPSLALKTGAPTNSSLSRPISRLHQAITGSQVALCTVLLICALLLAQSLSRVLESNGWLNSDRVLTLDMIVSPNRYQDASVRLRLYKSLLDQLNAYPGVSTAGLANGLPLKGQMWTEEISIRENPLSGPHGPTANFRFVSPQYFGAIGMDLLKGRRLEYNDADRHVMLISESLSRMLPPGLDPVGKHVLWTPPLGNAPLPYEIAGVLRDARVTTDQDAPPTVYLPFWEWPPWAISLAVRTNMDSAAISAGVRRLIRRIDSEIAIPHSETMREILDSAVAPRRFLTGLGALFAACATFLVALGLYGLISFTTLQRNREIGIRRALGAQDRQILRIVLSGAVRLALFGLTAGTLFAFVLTRLLASVLFDIKPTDPATYAAVWITLAGVALLASYLPARRATRADPMQALRLE